MTEHFLRYAYPSGERERVLAGVRNGVLSRYAQRGFTRASRMTVVYAILDILDRDFDGAQIQKPYRIFLAEEIAAALGWSAGYRAPDLDRLWPPCGLCALCGHPDKRHRTFDAIRERAAAGETVEELAADYEVTLEHIAAALAWVDPAAEGT